MNLPTTPSICRSCQVKHQARLRDCEDNLGQDESNEYEVEQMLYSPLESKIDTRLLVLEPGSSSDSLRGHLEVISPHASIYEAISYTWGDEGGEDFIELYTLTGTSGTRLRWHPVRIRNNLAICLRHLRLADKHRRLWVDALCISQTNIEEKNQQVANIGSVFREATMVLAWVGLPYSWTVPMLQEQERSTIPRSGLRRLLFGAKRPVKDPALVAWYYNYKPPTDPVSNFWDNNFSVSLKREYWKRTWIAQELILAQDITVVCGDYSRRWDEFFVDKREVATVTMGTIPRLRSEFRDYGQLSKTRSILSVSASFLGHKCSDPRDKIYALLQISSVRDRIRPDYSKPTGLLFFDVLAADMPNLLASYGDPVRGTIRAERCETVEILIQKLAINLRLTTASESGFGKLRTCMTHLYALLRTDLADRYPKQIKKSMIDLLRHLSWPNVDPAAFLAEGGYKERELVGSWGDSRLEGL